MVTPRLVRTRAALLGVAALIAVAASSGCEDPARPVPPAERAVLYVDSDPRGGAILIDGEPTGERTPAAFSNLLPGQRTVEVRLDTAGLRYGYTARPLLTDSVETRLAQPLVLRCTRAECLREASQFHSAGNLRVATSAAGPLFLYTGGDLGIVWPASTANSYASIGAATLTALVDGEPVALGLHNIGSGLNYWAGRPLPTLLSGPDYAAEIPAWIAPSLVNGTTIRGLAITHRMIIEAEHPDVVFVEAIVRNISTDSVYRLMDRNVPEEGIVFEEAWIGFMLDADVGPFTEARDDMVSYSADRGLVFAYDSDFHVTGFTGGWSTRPALVGLALLEAPGTGIRLNAWPGSHDFLSGVEEAKGRALLLAEQMFLPDHPDGRIGYAPAAEPDDYTLAVASGPFTLSPGEEATARFAVVLAAPAEGAFESGELLPAGDPADPDRPLAAAAARLFGRADSALDRQAITSGD